MNTDQKRTRSGRKRRVAGWTLLLLGLLVAGVWVASGWWPIEHSRTDLNILIDRGTLRLLYSHNASWSATYPASAESRALIPSFEWWGDDYYGHAHSWGLIFWEHLPGGWGAHVLLWPIPLLLCTPAALLLRSGILARRRANTGQCAKCGYSLAGLAADSPCPECGKAKTRLG